MEFWQRDEGKIAVVSLNLEPNLDLKHLWSGIKSFVQLSHYHAESPEGVDLTMKKAENTEQGLITATRGFSLSANDASDALDWRRRRAFSSPFSGNLFVLCYWLQ